MMSVSGLCQALVTTSLELCTRGITVYTFLLSPIYFSQPIITCREHNKPNHEHPSEILNCEPSCQDDAYSAEGRMLVLCMDSGYFQCQGMVGSPGCLDPIRVTSHTRDINSLY